MIELTCGFLLREVKLLSKNAEDCGQKLDGIVLLVVLEERVAFGDNVLNGFGSVRTRMLSFPEGI